jgi:soluble lytic murein transglycosylase-like protein
MTVHKANDFERSDMATTGYDPQHGKNTQSPIQVDEIIEHASKTYRVDPDLIRSVIRAESDFDTNATSPKGAMGLMQLMPETAKDLGVKNCYNPVENIMAGTRYLKKLLDRYDGNVELTLAAYNWGMGNVEKHPERLPMETRTYIARVNGFLNKART